MAVADDAVGTVVYRASSLKQFATGFHRSSSPQPTVPAVLMKCLHHRGPIPNLREPEKGFA
jgi:hypothetical protein